MKLSRLSLIVLAVAGSFGAVAPAVAQERVVHRTVVRHTEYRAHRPNMRRHRVCRTRWVNHRRVTRCR